MDSFKFHDIRVEKANAIAKYRKTQRITTLFRFVELFVFLIVLSRFSTQFAFSFNLSIEFLQGISVSLISQRSIFVVGNAIVIALFFISGQFSRKKGEKSSDFYDKYMEKYRNNQQTWCKEPEEKRASDAYRYSVCNEEKVLSRTHSANLERAEERRHDLRRSMSEKCLKCVDCGRRAAAGGGGGSPYVEDEMSNEEFRRTVEAFIARQQRFLREEVEFSAVVSI